MVYVLRAKNRKNAYPCKPQFYYIYIYIKVGCKGGKLHGHVSMMSSKSSTIFNIENGLDANFHF